MKNNIYYIVIGIVSMLIMASCQKDVMENSSNGEGGFSLALNVDDSETVATRAMSEEEVIESAKVKIYKPNFQGLIREYTYEDMPNIIYLPSGEGYRVDVIAGEAAKPSPSKATFEQKSYKGSAEFNIEANATTENVAVEAKICNAITNATFDPTIAENFAEGYTLTFSLTKDETDTNKTLVYTADKSEKDGYFIVDNPITEAKVYWIFNGNLNDGTRFSAKGTIEPVNGETVKSLEGARMTMNFKYVVKDGTLVFDLKVDTATENLNDIILWNPSSTGISPSESHEIWATFATVHADVDTGTYDADKVYFEYRTKVGSNTWTRIQASKPTEDGSSYSALIKGLTPNTEYEYQLVLKTKDTETTNDAGETVTVEGEEIVIGDGDDDGSADVPTTLTTGKNQQAPNASFEDGYKHSDGFYIFNPENGYSFSTYSPNNEPGKLHTWWGTGNQTAVGVTVNVSTRSDDIPHSENGNKKSARLESEWKMVKFAAGNLYSGYFYDLHQTTHGIVHFGRKKAADGDDFISRPTGVSFYVKYKGKKVNRDAEDGPLTTTDFDRGQIKFAIGTWGKKKYGGSDESPLAVDTYNKNTFWNIASLDETIAYCEKIFVGNGEDTGWQKVTLKFDYNSNGKGKTPKNPTHIIISAASSMYGDYFEGAEGSTMYLDDIQLLYDHPDDIQAGVETVQ